ncbi:MAG: DNA topoisomerase IV subunit A [Lentisphaeria bacterium]|nr:DNA topoisomerase IV subunit A [Lentisphaeria bacterium]
MSNTTNITIPDGESYVTRHEDLSSLHGMMDKNFLEYASYVIKDRAIPDIIDGMKPVQRRILHSLKQVDDGKFHKVANIIGHTMQYHPHGDASIGAALVNLANKNYFIERQGNFGNILTGDIASAARYIECRLTPLAREVMFNKDLTEFTDSYDGRNLEPLALPAKVPALLMQGVEGIAVGMATKVMPHNFNEVLQAQISLIKGEPFQLYPDFFQGAFMDASDYQDGNGRLKLRAKIEHSKDSTKAVVIREIAPSTTTESVIQSIEDAAKKNKIKIASIHDYTAEFVEIEVTFQRGVNVDKGIAALYAYTDCEVSISPNLIVIRNNRPHTMTVPQVLQSNTEKLVNDLKKELELDLLKQENLFHAKTLEQIFIEERIYKTIEECESFEEVISAVEGGLAPFRPLLKRDIVQEDVEKLLEIKIKRISRFDINKSRLEIQEIVDKIIVILDHLCHLRKFTIDFINSLLTRYGAQYPRLTQMDTFKHIDVKNVALKNVKVAYDRGSGMLGSSVKADETLACTEFDRLVIISKKDGLIKVIPIPEKLYIGKGMEVYKADKNQMYSIIYRDKKKDTIFAKRFMVSRYIMEKEYEAIPPGCRIDKIYTTYGVIIKCEYEPAKRQQVTSCEINFDDISKRSLTARGFKVTDKKIKKYTLLERGSDTPTVVKVNSTDDEEIANASEETDDVVVKKPLLNRLIKQVFTDAKELYSGRTFEVLDSTQKKVTSPKTQVANKKPTVVVEEVPVVEVKSEPIELDEPLADPIVDEVTTQPIPVEEVVEIAVVEKAEPVKLSEPEVVIEVPVVPEVESVEVPSFEEPITELVNPPQEEIQTEVLSEPIVEVKSGSTLKSGGYRETSAEERERRAKRFFKIDEDTPFSLES